MSHAAATFGVQLRIHCRKRVARARGTTISEMPLALWIIILLCFSLLILASITIRFGFFWNACRQAAQSGAKCQTFATTTSLGPSACAAADLMIQRSTAAFSGISANQVNIYILITDVNTKTTTKNPSRTALAAAADTGNFIYSIQVELIGQVNPLIQFPVQGLVGNVPGLTGPVPVVVRSQYAAEVPQGLNK